MDITFSSGENKFKYRVSAVIVNDGKLLALNDGISPYYYLPGGRVKMGETAECAMLREISEELEISAQIERPLWLVQGFFDKPSECISYHEICVYFLINISRSGLLERGGRFAVREGALTHNYEWVQFEKLKDMPFYPLFLKTEIFNLPENFTLRTERES